MILWIFKLVKTVRRAIAGRRYPHQLAWAVAFGLLLGIVPHGNLLALGLLILVLSLQINHAMAGLTAVAASFAATQLDPFSHQVGDYLLGHPEVAPWATAAWQLPLVPWTDLNNTVVLGSLAIGTVCLLPTFAVTYPLFRLCAPAVDEDEQEELAETSEVVESTVNREAKNETTHAATVSSPNSHQVVLIDRRHQQVSAPRQPADAQHAKVGAALSTVAADQHAAIDEAVKFTEVTDSRSSDRPSATSASESTSLVSQAANTKEAAKLSPDEKTDREKPAPKKLQAVETRIDVIRMKDHRAVDATKEESTSPAADNEPMDEALNYLLRQLRDSQQRKAA